MYYFLEFKIAKDGYLAESMDISHKEILDNKTKGEAFNIKELCIELPASRGRLMDFVDNLESLLIVEESLKNQFELLDSDNLEAYKVNIKRKTDKTFYYINILNDIDCIDFEKSVYKELIPGIKVLTKVEKLVLKIQNIKNRHMFRIKGLSYHIVISKEMKLNLQNLNIEGLEFIAIENFTLDSSKFTI
ncbi:MAG: hypothetical protein N4A49_09650 [Marinifilaceae bacterium]|jgi:hypothetical protein|nr:hypothetical protein [Marinifilaceae bacterium]